MIRWIISSTDGGVGRMKLAPFIFVTGGVRSGKSSFAEKVALAKALKRNGNLHYIACGRPVDDEMKGRIKLHQADREECGFSWTTWEQPNAIGNLATEFSNMDVVLLDCLTTLLNNELFREKSSWKNPHFQDDVKETIISDLECLRETCGSLILVSNEVLNEVPIDNPLVFTYTRLLGQLHQSIVKNCTSAILVEAGIPFSMKGSLPSV
ncbi:bifunctional adenosylcobinamide kinase/adenosylcobinamide-phosphate guanylyltransferase [Lederbergia citrea]|nr:bifunctional adenosylcobinamide kinase/adenosylcobinamide-phosphate guanylyltransferase [Lederbergia citrea]